MRTMPRPRSSGALLLPAGLAAAGVGAMVVAVGRPEVLWLAVPWCVVLLVVAGVWRRTAAGRGAHVAAAVLLVAALVVLAFEGGLFFVPAALALLVVSAIRR